jgi:hypothetical protein
MGQSASVHALSRTETIIIGLLDRVETLEKSNAELKRLAEESRKQIKTINTIINDINFEVRRLTYKT